jgi:hypothetical protein
MVQTNLHSPLKIVKHDQRHQLTLKVTDHRVGFVDESCFEHDVDGVAGPSIDESNVEFLA